MFYQTNVVTSFKSLSPWPLQNSHFKVCRLKTTRSFSPLQDMLSSCLLYKASPFLLTTKPFLEEVLGRTQMYKQACDFEVSRNLGVVSPAFA